MNADDQIALQLTGYRVVNKTWAQVKAIMSEFDMSEANLRQALKDGHGIEIDDTPRAVNMLYFVIDQQMQEKLKEYRIESPTMLQLLGTSRAVGVSEKDAAEKFTALVREDN